MPTGSSTAAGGLVVLRELAADLGEAVSVDDVARVALFRSTQIPGVVRAGIALSQGAGRQLRFVASDGDAVSPTAVRWCHIDGLADVPLAQTVRDGVGIFLRSLDELATRYPHMLERQRPFGTRSMAALPLSTRDGHLGGLLLSFGSERAFGTDEQALLAAFVAQLSQAMRRALNQRAQQTTAERLQRSLLPQSLPDLDGLSVGAHYHPGSSGADVGGDWYDALCLDDGSAVVAIGDVTGKGSSAAVVMGQVRAAMRAYALLDPAPAMVLERLDAVVRSLAVPEQIVTMVYGLADRDRRTLTLAVAGHPPPLLLGAEGAPEVLYGDVGPPLGLGVRRWAETTVDLADDLTMLFYSNGLVESREVDFFSGLDRLCDDIARLESGRRNPREICSRLGDLAWGRNAEDDVTMLALSRTSRHALHTATEQLPADASASPLARRFVTSRLAEWGVDDEVVETAQLCVSELVTNAVIHSGTPSKVTVRLDEERLLVSVQDGGSQGAVRQISDDDEPMISSGRGLTIVDVLATTWSAERSPEGTTVWFELDVTARAGAH